MDITTVLEIIKILDARIDNHTASMEEYGVSEEPFARGVNRGLTIAREHLQSYIEQLLNAAENQSTEQ